MSTIKIVNGTIEPAIRLDVEGRVLAKCPQCEREYHLDEHTSEGKGAKLATFYFKNGDKVNVPITDKFASFGMEQCICKDAAALVRIPSLDASDMYINLSDILFVHVNVLNKGESQ